MARPVTAPHALTASAAAARIAAGQLTAEALVRSCLDRIAARETDVRAWLALDPERALAEARDADRRAPAGPLHGIPFGIKDVIDTADLSTTYGSPLYRGFRPAADARCVTLLRQAGAIILGKTATVEFAAAGHQPPTRNPRNLAHTPGGSSSGSAAAVADLMVPLALGTQTGGSTIRPAGFTGIYALKPSFGTVARDGVRAYAPSLDTVGWFARSIADLDCVAQVFDLPARPAPPPGDPLRIGLYRGPHWGLADAAARTALDEAAELLRRQGVMVADCTFGDPFDGLTQAQETIMYGEGRVSFLPEARLFGAGLHPALADIAANRRAIGAAALCEAQDRVAECRILFDARVRADCDAVLTLAAPGEAPLGFTTTGDATFNKMWTALGVPCLALPFAFGRTGLPIGLQLVAARSDDRRLLGVGAIVERKLRHAQGREPCIPEAPC